MGDDIDAPHDQMLSVPNSATIAEILRQVIDSHYLASIAGGKATWSAASGDILAVIAQEWPEPRLLTRTEMLQPDLATRDGVPYLHFAYYAQKDPNVVLEVLNRLRLEA